MQLTAGNRLRSHPPNTKTWVRSPLRTPKVRSLSLSNAKVWGRSLKAEQKLLPKVYRKHMNYMSIKRDLSSKTLFPFLRIRVQLVLYPDLYTDLYPNLYPDLYPAL